MRLLRRMFLGRIGPDLFRASVVQPVLTGIGVFTFLAGVLYLPSLGPSRVEGIICLLLLAVLALLCASRGQLVAVAEHFNKRGTREEKQKE
jgi:hypothetical protein